MDNPENTEGAIKNGQSRETGNIGYTRGRKTKQKDNTIYIGHYYVETNTNNVNKSWLFLIEVCVTQSWYAKLLRWRWVIVEFKWG